MEVPAEGPGRAKTPASCLSETHSRFEWCSAAIQVLPRQSPLHEILNRFFYLNTHSTSCLESGNVGSAVGRSLITEFNRFSADKKTDALEGLMR